MRDGLTIDKRAKALIFDIDGTLANSMPLHLDAWKHAADQHGFEYDESFFVGVAGMSTVKIVERLAEKQGLVLDPHEVTGSKRNYFIARMDKIQPIQSVVDVLKAYAGKMPVGAGTGAGRKNAENVLKIIGVDHLIDTLVSSDDVVHPKPAPDTFLKCADELGVAPAECQVFEDGDFGIQAAKEAGMMVTDVRQLV